MNTGNGHICQCGKGTAFDYHGEQGNHRYCCYCSNYYILDFETDEVIEAKDKVGHPLKIKSS